MYENQNLKDIYPLIKHIKIAWRNKISPIDKGWFKNKKIILNIIEIVNNKYKISKDSLIKILVLGIDDKNFLSFEVLKVNLIFGLQDQCFTLNY